MNVLFRFFAILALAGAPFAAFAAAPGDSRAPAPSAAVSGAPMSGKERSDATKAFVAKWGNYVKRVYAVDAATWARRMAPVFAVVDAKNFRDALTRDTFEGAMAEISGAGNKLTDKQAMELLGKAKPSAGSTSAPNALGALANDLVYTPLQPCRVVDTRNTGAGRIAANSSRNFIGIGASNFTSQGGSSTDCGTLGLNATALALNVTAVQPSTTGFATVFPYGTTRPLAASITYGPNAIVNNTLIAQIPNPLSSFDYTIFTSSQAHYVVDIVGYFAPPVATALECVTTSDTVFSVDGGDSASSTAPACPSGYMGTATNCYSQYAGVSIFGITDGFCSAYNGGLSPTDVRVSRKCCRVPGR